MKAVPAYSRFLEAPDTPCAVLAWFRAQDMPFREHPFKWGTVLYFFELGELRIGQGEELDSDHSPVVALYLPRVRRGVLWTVGEVRFCPTPLSQFPKLARLRKNFLRWFKQFPLVYDHIPSPAHEHDYYLEGSSQNVDGPIHAFPSGLDAIRNGQYFVSHHDEDFSTLCKKLALRGVTCGDE